MVRLTYDYPDYAPMLLLDPRYPNWVKKYQKLAPKGVGEIHPKELGEDIRLGYVKVHPGVAKEGMPPLNRYLLKAIGDVSSTPGGRLIRFKI